MGLKCSFDRVMLFSWGGGRGGSRSVGTEKGKYRIE